MEIIISIPLVIQVPLIAGLLTLLGVILTTSVTKGQLKVSRQTLFVSMLPRRIEWLDKFRKAVSQWDSQMQTIINYEGYDPPEPTALFELGLLVQEATWLLGDDVAKAARNIEKALDKLRDLRIKAASKTEGAHDAATSVSQAAFDAYQLFEPLSDAIKSKLYVGNIQNDETPKYHRLR